MSGRTIAERLEALRESLRSESISYGELAELQDLTPHIDPDDVELLEAAGVPEGALSTYVKRAGIVVEVKRDRGAQLDENGWEHHAYVLTLTSPHGTIETPWRQGYGVETHPTDAPAEILGALLSDVTDESFDDWCADFGCDTDSRKAFATWEACTSLRPKLVTLLGSDDELETAMAAER